MNLLLYARETNGPGERLRSVIQGVVPEDRTETCRDLPGLIRRLRRPVNGFDIAVLLASTKEDLEDILSIRNLLSDLRIILVLPDRGKSTISKGHSLRPRFLSYADSNLGDVGAVLAKMIENSCSKS
jgi:hypothetical protein